ncbi:uncharacterized protein JCM6883_004972 [Sporobolomyces salmoneus]|uniref:uncharacterized protein n=1 Tax=Sporobolomyces salmoneus TaxID=183962 RepID=UPI00317FF99E
MTASSSSSIARLTSSETNYAHFRAHHLVPNVPCIFPPSLIQHWRLFSLWFTPSSSDLDYEYLVRTYGSLPIDCIDCEAEGEAEEAEVSTFGELLALWKHGKGRKKYLKDWHLPLEVHRSAGGTRKGKEKVRDEVYEVEGVCLDDWMNEYEGNGREGKEDDFRFVYAGGGDTFTPLHRDVYCSYSISTQISGRKLWYLFPPSCTSAFLPLITQANREGRGVNCDEWSEEVKDKFRAKGMIEVWQEERETIFIPSGWYHSVHNLSHPTISLNHNWANSHNLPSIYSSLSEEAARCRDAIIDVKELFIEKARREGRASEGEGAWKGEWEEEVEGLVERSEGWSWRTFWKMIVNTLRNLEISREELGVRFEDSRWPIIPPHARPPTSFVIERVRPLVEQFRKREEGEWKWLEGFGAVLSQVEEELIRLSEVVET